MIKGGNVVDELTLMLLVPTIETFIKCQLASAVETAWEAGVFTQFICLLSARASVRLSLEAILC